MNWSALAAAWIVALIVSVSSAFLLSRNAATQQVGPFHKSDIVVIGSSLMRNAFPTRMPGGILADGRSNRVYAIGFASEEDCVLLMQAAVRKRVKTIFLEVNPFVMDFANKAAQFDDTPGMRWTRLTTSVSKRLRTGFAEWIGFDKAVPFSSEPSLVKQLLPREPPHFHRYFDGKLVRPERYYPVNVHAPRDDQALRDVVGSAVNQGIKVVLIAPPHSEAAGKVMGTSNEAALSAEIDAVASELKLPVFAPAASWPNEFFVDRGHLNEEGRDRFVAAFRQWWSTQK